MSVDENVLLPTVVVAVLKESGYDKHTATWTLGGDGQGRTMLTLKWPGNSSVSNLDTDVRAKPAPASITTNTTGVQTDAKKDVTVATQTPVEWIVKANVKTQPALKATQSERQKISSNKRTIKQEHASDKRTQNDSVMGPGPNKVSKLDRRFSSKPSLPNDEDQRLRRDKKTHSETRTNTYKRPAFTDEYDRYMEQSHEGIYSERRNSYPENIHDYNHNGSVNSFKKRIVCEENLITYNKKILTHAEIPGVPESKSIIYLKLHDKYGAAPKVANIQRATDFYNELYTGFKYGPDATEYKRLLPLLIDHANSYLLHLANVMGIDALPCPVPYLDLEMEERTGMYVDIKL
ncbi:hypothetical protein ACJMK2_030912 [Sinanodonta woodiana]|uniref:Uncharacterized protein n=1 Tax=Sinanodonta woodiana TaxID=1069815 RepID=A0ABD3X156_SINWO